MDPSPNDIESNPSVQFYKELVSIYSPSGSEAKAAECAVNRMKALGYRDSYIDQAGSPVGHWGEPSDRNIMLLGHIDTVKGEIETRTEERDGHLIFYGRGSVDAKGPLACFIEAVATLPKDLSVEIVVVGAVEEEVASSKGARNILDTFSEPDFVIIGEPSNTNGITLGYKGRLVANLNFSREMTHGAHEHTSASELAFEFHTLVKNYTQQANLDCTGIFSPLDYSIQSLNTSSDGLHETAKMNIGFRLGPEFCPNALEETLSSLLNQFKATFSEVLTSCDFEAYGKEVPAQHSKRSALARAFRTAIRQEQLEPKMVLKTGTSDMNVLGSKWDCDMVAYGPGDSALDHTPHENISLNDYLKSISVLSRALRRLANSD